jgi:prevent-host-death family protein
MTATTRSKAGGQNPPPGNRWRLQDAKARLSEVVREAQTHGPQRVTLHGRDAVVVVGAAEFDRMQRPVTGRDIVQALRGSRRR